MKKCLDEKIGQLIAAYEIDELNEEEREIFEKHLMECEYCSESLIELAPVIIDMQNREGVFAEWEGKSFDDLADELKGDSLLAKTKKGFESIIGKLSNIEILNFEPFPMPAMVLRGKEDHDNYQKYWREAYRKENYKIAIKYLKKVDKHSPDQWETLMFLGICLYIEKQPKPAVKALRKADELSGLSMKEEIRWYLAQSLLLKGEQEEGIRQLTWLSSQPGREYPKKAQELLSKL
jgi:tetratricopeptide (TPR) repeat protein